MKQALLKFFRGFSGGQRGAAPLAANHRLILGFEAELEGIKASDVLKRVLEAVKS